jgi:hypothetical protein
LQGFTTASLAIARVTPAVAGTYRVEATNASLPGLTLVSRPFVVSTAVPSSVPQEMVRLLEPSPNATDVPVIPRFAWTSVKNAGEYRLEMASNQDFTNVFVTQLVEQTTESVQRGRVELSAQTLQSATNSAFQLLPLSQYYWRVRAENARGAGVWSGTSFVTAGRDAALGINRLDFGRVPRLDTAVGELVVRNIANTELRILSLASSNPMFQVVDMVERSIRPGEETRVVVRFIPERLQEQAGDVRITYTLGSSTTAQEQTLQARLRGDVIGIKIIPPSFDTVLVGQARIASALVINRGDRAALVRSLTIQSPSGIFGSGTTRQASGEDMSIGAGDTIAVMLRCVARRSGEQERGALEYAATFAMPNRDERGSVPLTAFARERTATDPVAKVGIRVRGDKTRIVPGSAVTLELYLASGNRTALVQNTSLVIGGTFNFDRNVLVLEASERSVRRVRPSSPTQRIERFAFAPVRWDGRSEVLATVQCRAVAGDVDSTEIELENIVWQGALLEEFVQERLKLNICEAGGKRLVTTAQPSRIALVVPNPAKDEVRIAYTLREDGFAELALVDASGKVAKILVAEEQTAGEHEVRSSVSMLPSGTYTIRLQTSTGAVSTKVNVVR